MKAILEFDLPDDREEFEIALRAGRYASVIDDLREAFRQKCKYEPEQTTTWSAARELLIDTLNQRLEY